MPVRAAPTTSLASAVFGELVKDGQAAAEEAGRLRLGRRRDGRPGRRGGGWFYRWRRKESKGESKQLGADTKKGGANDKSRIGRF